jgi:hypothetical protein
VSLMILRSAAWSGLKPWMPWQAYSMIVPFLVPRLVKNTSNFQRQLIRNGGSTVIYAFVLIQNYMCYKLFGSYFCSMVTVSFIYIASTQILIHHSKFHKKLS